MVVYYSRMLRTVSNQHKPPLGQWFTQICHNQLYVYMILIDLPNCNFYYIFYFTDGKLGKMKDPIQDPVDPRHVRSSAVRTPKENDMVTR